MTQAQATATAPVASIAPTERLVLRGELTLNDGKRLWQQLRATLPSDTDLGPEPRKVSVDLSAVTTADGSAAALLATFRAELIERGIPCEFIGANSALEELLKLYEGGGKPRPRKKRKPVGLLEQIGAASISIVVEAQLVIAFFGQMMIGFGIALRAPRTVN
ncbi:MAG: hypothetical protein RL701_1760, partial [Pseudomonadota bacterium]